MKFMKIFRFVVFPLMLVGCFDLSTAKQAELPATETVLASERTLQLGEMRLQLPVLLLLSSTTDTGIIVWPKQADLVNGKAIHQVRVSMQTLFSNSTHMEGDELELAYMSIDLGSLKSLQDYRTDEHVSTNQVCPLLQRQWARNICESGLIDGHRVFYPDYFTLIDEKYLIEQRPDLAVYGGHWLSVGEAASASIPPPSSNTPVPHCQQRATGEKNSLCTVVARVAPNVLAVWSTNREHAEEANEVEKQANRIRCLISRGMQTSIDSAVTC